MQILLKINKTFRVLELITLETQYSVTVFLMLVFHSNFMWHAIGGKVMTIPI